MGKNIYVGNLSYNSTEDSLTALFGQYGTVLSARVITDRETGRSRGFAFVEMDNDGSDEAIRELNGKEVDGRVLKVNEARPRESRPPRNNRW